MTKAMSNAPIKLSDEEYAKSLPKKQVGTAVLFFNQSGELLVVKPNYKDSWLVPGGSAEQNESPLACALRETQEEIGLAYTTFPMVGLYYAPEKGPFSDSLKFIFNGGILSDEQIESIQLEEKELEGWAFMPISIALPLLSASLQKCLPQSLAALETGAFAYIENI